MEYRLTLHAREEMSDRNIPIQMVERVMADPEQSFEEDGLIKDWR